jgi:hypothetical protein
MANVRKERISSAIYWLITALTLVNLGVALFWAPAHGSY